MKKSWKIVGVIILTVFVLGLICIGVGYLTGADFSRIYPVIDDKFQIDSTLKLYSNYFAQIKETLTGIF